MELCLAKEHRVLDIFEHAFSYFELEDWVKILSISKTFMTAISQSPRIFVLILKKYYLSQDHLHPTLRRYFQILLTKRPKIDVSNLSGIAKEIYLMADYRIRINKNLIRDAYCVKMPQDLEEIKGKYCRRYHLSNHKPQHPLIQRTHGGDGWRLKKEVIPEFRKRTLSSSFEMCDITYRAFFRQFPPGFLQDFKNGKTVIKAGCFISRRQDCEAHGGCILKFFDSNDQMLFEVREHKTSEEIPISWKSDFVYQEIAFQVSSKDLPENTDFENCSMKLIIYGKDERWWKGYYGSRFIAMHIRGDFAENPLKNLLS